MNINTSGIILSAAKADITICEVFGDLPTGLIPVNGKPIVFFILEQFLEANIIDIYIGVDYKKDKLQEIVDLYFKDKLNIKYVETNKSEGVGNSFLKIISTVKTNKIVVNLADTYIKDIEFNNLSNVVVVSNDYLNEERWDTVELDKNKIIKSFNNKIQISNALVVTGIYSFSDISIFSNFKENRTKIEITEILNFYHLTYPLAVCETDNWLDFGHIDKYYISKKRLIQSRGFNSLEYNDLLGTITKRSENIEKFIGEIKWQLNLPKNIKVLVPRVLDYSLDKNPYITMEFYSYPTLSEIWLFSELHEQIYFSIIDKLFKILELFRLNKKSVSTLSYKQIYIDKTKARVLEIENITIKKLLRYNTLILNGKIVQNWTSIQNNIFAKIDDMYIENDNCFIHGDFCLSNILYDLRSGLVRLIDPRGIWGENENGDIKYDIAKLRHSIVGDYDYIVNDLFNVFVEENTLNYKIYNSNKKSIKDYFDEKLAQYYTLNQIKMIEGLLFLSMITLHSDNSNRQLVMYAKAMEIFDEIS